MLFLLLLGASAVAASRVVDYEVVHPRMIVARNGQKRLKFHAFGEDFHLRLEPSNILHDDFYLIKNDGKNEHYVKPDVEKLKRSFFQDPIAGATVHIDDIGPLKITGIINHELRIEPHITEYNDRVEREIRGKFGYDVSRQDLEKESQAGEMPHRINKIDLRNDEEVIIYDEVIPPGVKGGNESTRTPHTGTENRQSKSVTVETGIVADSTLSAQFVSIEDFIRYICVLLNSANLKFATMKNIEVKFQLCMAYQCLDASCEPYITQNLYDEHLLPEEGLHSFCQYCANHKNLSQNDVVHLITKRPMGDKQPGTTKAATGTLGIAFVGGVCDKNYKCGISDDDGICFSGTGTIAHETGHLCGCPHDGEPKVSYIPGSPGSEKCSWDLGYIMSYVRKDEKQHAFSPCCEECVIQLSSLSESGCMQRKDVKYPISSSDTRLPGQYLQEKTGYTTSAKYYDYRCKNKDVAFALYKAPQGNCAFHCMKKAADGLYYAWTFQCSDGDQCGTNKMCKNGYCV